MIEKNKAGRPIGSGTNGRKRVLSPDEVKRLKAAADEQGLKYGLIIRLILELALRVCELTGLRVADFNSASRPHQVTVRGAKGGFTASYDLPERLWARYTKWLKVREPKESPWVFPSRLYGGEEHMTMMGVQGTFRALCRRAGIPGQHSIHDLRHTAATRMAEAGDSAVAIASRLRHRSLSSAQVYIDFSSTKAHDAIMIARYED
jgi:integrase